MKNNDLSNWKLQVRNKLEYGDVEGAENLISSYQLTFRHEEEFKLYIKVVEAFDMHDPENLKIVIDMFKELRSTAKDDEFVHAYYHNFVAHALCQTFNYEQAYAHIYKARKLLPKDSTILEGLRQCIVSHITSLNPNDEAQFNVAIEKIYELKALGYPETDVSLISALMICSVNSPYYDKAIELLTDLTLLSDEDVYQAYLELARARKMAFSCTPTNIDTTLNLALYTSAKNQASIHKISFNAQHYINAIQCYNKKDISGAIKEIIDASNCEPNNKEINNLREIIISEYKSTEQQCILKLQDLLNKYSTHQDETVREEIVTIAFKLFDMNKSRYNLEKALEYYDLIRIYGNEQDHIKANVMRHHMYQQLAKAAFNEGKIRKAIQYCYKIVDQTMLKPLYDDIHLSITKVNDSASQLLANQSNLELTIFPLVNIPFTKKVKSLIVHEKIDYPASYLTSIAQWLQSCIFLEHLKLNLTLIDKKDVQNFIINLLPHPSLVSLHITVPCFDITSTIKEAYFKSTSVIHILKLQCGTSTTVLQRFDHYSTWQQLNETLPKDLGATKLQCLTLYHLWKSVSQDLKDKERFGKLVSESSELTLCLLFSALPTELIPMILDNLTDYALLDSALPAPTKQL